MVSRLDSIYQSGQVDEEEVCEVLGIIVVACGVKRWQEVVVDRVVAFKHHYHNEYCNVLMQVSSQHRPLYIHIRLQVEHSLDD